MPFQLFIVGLTSILGQVAVLRELNVAFYGEELTYILSIGGWMACTAAGAYWGRRSFTPSRTSIALLFLIAGLIIPLEIAAARSIHFTLGGVTGTYLPILKQIFALLIILFPTGFSYGLLFQWTAKQYCGRGGSLAWAYTIESTGGIAGGLLSTILLGLQIGNFSIAVVCSAVAAGMSFGALHSGAESRIRYPALIPLFLIMIVLVFSSRIDHWMTAWNHPDLILSKDSPYGRLTVVKRENQVIIFDNGALRLDSQSAASEKFVHMTAVQHERPESILICGAGESGVVREVRKHDPLIVDYVEVNRMLIDTIRSVAPSHFGPEPYSPQVNIECADPRTFLESADEYDIIFLAAPPPNSGRSNRFYTIEFFDLCRSRLASNGILVFQLPSSENLWTPALLKRNAAVYSAVNSIFSDVIVIPGETDIFMASESALIREPKRLISRFISRGIAAGSIPPAYIRYAYTNDRFAAVQDNLQSAGVDPNSDTSPAAYRYAMMHFVSKFIGFDDRIKAPSAFLTGAAAVIVCLAIGIAGRFIGRRNPEIPGLLQILAAACTGMIMESVLILDYEINCGVLFQNIGVLLMMFMAGLAAGSISVFEYMEFRLKMGKTGVKHVSRLLFFAFGFLNALFFMFMAMDLSGSLALVSGFLFINGFLVAGVFAYVTFIFKKEPALSVSSIYAADALGGGIGSVAGALILIPFVGAADTVVLLSGTAFLFGILF